MKKDKILFWIPTIIIFLFEGVLVALTSHSQMSIDGITGLGYPLYFVTVLAVFKIIGCLVLVIPQIPPRVKEWAYAGFMIDFLMALISMIAVAGLTSGVIFPIVFIGLLIMSYVYYHKLQDAKKAA
jgi:hypothetical protein